MPTTDLDVRDTDISWVNPSEQSEWLYQRLQHIVSKINHDKYQFDLDTLDVLQYAKYKETESNVFLKDSVRVINVLGDTLYCNELNWDLKKTGAEFYTDKPVRIRTRTQIIDGIGMEAKQDFTEWHIIQPVGFLKVPAAQFPN
jgi:hypothetical protein